MAGPEFRRGGDNVVELNPPGKKPPPVDNGGGGGNDAGMEARVAVLEEVVKSLATKADVAELRTEVHKGFSEMTKWIVGTAIAVSAAAITVGTFVLNNATPKAASSPQPTVIIVPTGAPAAQAAPK